MIIQSQPLLQGSQAERIIWRLSQIEARQNPELLLTIARLKDTQQPQTIMIAIDCYDLGRQLILLLEMLLFYFCTCVLTTCSTEIPCWSPVCFDGPEKQQQLIWADLKDVQTAPPEVQTINVNKIHPLANAKRIVSTDTFSAHENKRLRHRRRRR